ncbi:MAG: YIP1 family protein [Chloroflexi bacterium]|nr:YIP1 family protein [Chloroflexota bacterium]
MTDAAQPMNADQAAGEADSTPTPVAQPATTQDKPEERFPLTAPLFGVPFRPRRTFERLRDAERGHWWVLALLILIFAGVSAGVNAYLTTLAAFDSVEAFDSNNDGEISEQERQTFEGTQQLGSSNLALISAIFGGVFTGIGVVIIVALRGGVIYLLALAFGGRAEFKQVFRMGVWTAYPLLIRSVVTLIAGAIGGGTTLQGLAAMMTTGEITEAPLLAAFLSGIDVYMIWSMVLVAIGVAATERFKAGKSITITLILWLVGVIATLAFTGIGVAIGQAFGGGV